MNISLFITITLAVIVTWCFDWPKVKKKAGKDKTMFILLFLLGWLLSMLNLPETPGLTTLFQIVFQPLEPFVKK
ncbi:hypothetical protein [Paenibacillus xylaniclasticus]|uniref:hypothetical protein n=1 Tax=Paenibacillus xylaniclasticus TaxID=588083 RepID=UPI000FDB348F|nr:MULTISPECIES: hypothetical protein [Paenibacillus]GFN30100.1 hypothetical protein PCURB6_03600 [Paenibacillus curdlanolyticus]